MTDPAPNRRFGGIDIPKTIAAVLAAVSAAVLGSYLGVAGTVAGAAVASVVGTLGTELYYRSINKGTRKLQETFVLAPAAVGTPPVAAARERTPAHVGALSAESETSGNGDPVSENAGSPTEPTGAPAQVGATGPAEDAGPTATARGGTTGRTPGDGTGPPYPVWHRIRWKRVAVLAGTVFVLAMGMLTTLELISGRSARDVVGGRSPAGTTICSVLCGHRDQSARRPTPATSDPSGPAPSASPSAAPSSGPVSTAPSAPPSTAGSPDPNGSATPTASATPTVTRSATPTAIPTGTTPAAGGPQLPDQRPSQPLGQRTE